LLMHVSELNKLISILEGLSVETGDLPVDKDTIEKIEEQLEYARKLQLGMSELKEEVKKLSAVIKSSRPARKEIRLKDRVAVLDFTNYFVSTETLRTKSDNPFYSVATTINIMRECVFPVCKFNKDQFSFRNDLLKQVGFNKMNVEEKRKYLKDYRATDDYALNSLVFALRFIFNRSGNNNFVINPEKLVNTMSDNSNLFENWVIKSKLFSIADVREVFWLLAKFWYCESDEIAEDSLKELLKGRI
jgi:hypothetical protein